MKKIYNREQFFYIKGQTKEFQPTSICRHLCVMDEEQAKSYERKYGYQSFPELWELVESGVVRNAKAQKGLFGSRSIHFESGIGNYTVQEKSLKEVTIWWHCTECPNITMAVLLRDLPAEDLIEYLRERSIGLNAGD